ncbi:hypothetical protein BCO_0900161 (plasmid) [Borrelia coriaceae ATCC 43381]|uniref:Uncharacterized protein n=1 Tax=Borrelia coriaceae ATCC 43381 TaxID=1408429 RepID=W5T3Q5_9SPIR|nr:hypothetical protein [Borrelia coriaceae]AHH11926.1 hypothetical protein BCO_0900161 [Borrelia coriaceae ATCC 43381]
MSLLNMIGPMAASTLRLLWFKMSDPVHYKNFSIKATKEELIVLNHAVEKYMNMLEKMYVRIYEVIDCAIGKKDHSPEIFYDTFNALINSKSIKEGARAVSYEAFEIRNLMERILNRD